MLPFITSLLRPNHSPAVTEMQTTPDTPRPLILKVDAKSHRVDSYKEGLVNHGFQVVRGATLKEGLKLARRAHPDLCLVVDNPKAGLDGKEWLTLQHSDVEANLAMIPLIIITERKRLESLLVHEIPGRVKILTTAIPIEDLVAIIVKFLTPANF